MIIFPAIDILSGQCVRLEKGDYSTAERVAEDPLITAARFKEAGAEWVHMVDLDGARCKEPVNTGVFLRVAAESGLKVELGGGIRNEETVSYYLENGISRVILGSAAVKNPQLVSDCIKHFGAERIAVGIDAKGERVATEGWIETDGAPDYTALAKKMEQCGVKYIIYTDISRDGMLSGPSFERLFALSGEISCNITASGGVTTVHDIEKLRDGNIYAAICGKALYTGDLNLEQAISAAKR